MDALSDLLTHFNPQSHLSAGLRAGGDWSLAFAAPEGVKFNAIIQGKAWVRVEGHPQWHSLNQGDAFLLPRGLPFYLASDPRLQAVDSTPLYQAAQDSQVVYQGGADFLLLGARFAFAAGQAAALIALLPPIIIVPTAGQTGGETLLAWGIRELGKESQLGLPGGRLVRNHLAQLMFIAVLRQYIADPSAAKQGVFAGLADPQLSKALAAIHAEPGRPWNLAQLADLATMSRSVFAARFSEKLGEPPMTYLLRWRMHLAARQLSDPQSRVSQIAFGLGYESESAFTKAFRSVHGCSPRAYRSPIQA